VQPGSFDGGTADDKVAELARFVPNVWETAPPEPPGCPVGKANKAMFNFVTKKLKRKMRLYSMEIQQDEWNKIDAALAYLVDDSVVEKRILDIGVPKGWRRGTTSRLGSW